MYTESSPYGAIALKERRNRGIRNTRWEIFYATRDAISRKGAPKIVDDLRKDAYLQRQLRDVSQTRNRHQKPQKDAARGVTER